MGERRWRAAAAGATAVIMFLAAGCAKQAPAPPAPPAPKQNIFALLPDPEKRDTTIVVTNAGGTQAIEQPNQAVRVERADVAPTAPFAIDPPTVRRLFGTALDALPDAEVRFILHFDEARDTLNTEAQAQMPAILKAVQERRSTSIRVTGHTDTTGTPQANYELGLRRAQRVADVLRAEGIPESSLFIASHGEADLLKKTERGIAEPLNRRVEVIVH